MKWGSLYHAGLGEPRGLTGGEAYARGRGLGAGNRGGEGSWRRGSRPVVPEEAGLPVLLPLGGHGTPLDWQPGVLLPHIGERGWVGGGRPKGEEERGEEEGRRGLR